MTIRILFASFETKSWHKFHVFDRNGARQHQKGLRAWLAWSFRWIADRIDGANSMSVDLNSTPSLSEREKIMVINRGLQHSRNLFLELVEQEALDAGMREALPELYREESCKTKS